MADELSSPLGKKQRKKFSLRFAYGTRNLPVGRILFAVAGLIIAGFIVRIILVDEPDGGQPVAEVPISTTRNSNEIANQLTSPEPNGPIIVSNEPASPQVMPISQEVAIPVNAAGVPDKLGNLSQLTEDTQNGPIPRIGPSGQTPFKAYSRASIGPEAIIGQPVIAIIVTGMGINESTTLDAISTLPDNITLAFVPYGRTLERTTAAARTGGHEILLEIPMEPFDYPNSDPGPHTLLTGFPARANLDRLFWLMARTGGYMGMINNQGAKFTSSATDLGPFMEELGSRGIGYLDDGSSNRSLARQLANANQVPFARASLDLDQTPSRAAILTRLQQLVDIARRDGQAVGVISALPVSISTIVSWAAQLEELGVELVPASALMRVQN